MPDDRVTIAAFKNPIAACFLFFALICFVLPAAGARAARAKWQIVHHEIEAELSVEGHHLQVLDRVRFSPPPAPDAPLHLLLNRDLSLPAVRMNTQELAVDESDDFVPRHFWKRPPYDRLDDYRAGREITVSPPEGGWPANPLLEFSYEGAVYDSLHPPKVAYQRSFETTTGLIDERGAFLSGTTFWLPWCGDGTFSYVLETLTPKDWEIVSQGRRTSRTVQEDGRVRTRWMEEHPMGEAYLVAGPYRVRQAQHGKVELYTFTYANTTDELCRTYLDAAGKYIDMYSGMLGPYPFSKFALVENWWQTGFGMPSFTLLGNQVIRLPFIVHTSYGHEILHNWWGNGVFVDPDQGNWCEGLTTYLADHLYKLQTSPSAAVDYRRAQLQAYLDYAASGGRDFPLRKFKERESASTQAVGYGKTMMVFHMAENRAGTETFLEALRRFYHDHLFEEASWDDLISAFASTGDRGWEQWFDQWISRPGALDLSARLNEAGNGTARLVVRQKEPIYEVAVPVRLQNEDGKVTQLRLALDGPQAEMAIGSEVKEIEVDPGCDLFRLLHRSEIPPALSQTLGASKSVVVIAEGLEQGMDEALSKLAHQWAKNQDMLVVHEDEFKDDPQRSVWLLGDGDLIQRTLAMTSAYGDQPGRVAQRARDEGLSAVITVRDPKDENRSWSMLLPASRDAIEAVGRKLTHYGRYSYLLFDGEKNVAKANFKVENSPLRFSRKEK